MCGINGIYYFDNKRIVPPELIERMNYVLRHRGPDDSDVWINGNIGLGQARLSIIDLSIQGRQPMSNEDGSIWMTFNGEIYNYRELKKNLEAKGHRFRSQTDSEVILHLWEEKGVGLLDELRGMFAIALWDDCQKTLFLARDRMGQKPLFYTDLPGRIVFGSEIKAILQDPEFIPEPDPEALLYYLTFQSVPAPYCAFKGIKKLPPAHYLLARGSHISVQRYWQLSYQDKIQVNTPAAQKELEIEIIDRLREAVQLRLMSDVPLGAFLSGGIDSSIIVALMASLIDQPVKTFSIGFKENSFNETQYARKVAERYNTDHHEFIVTPDAQAIFPDLVWHYNEPYADSSAIPTYYVSKLARQHVTVVLTGDAGDENFAGYPRYQFRGEFAPDYGPVYPSALQRILKPGADERIKSFGPRGRLKANDIRRLRDLGQDRLLYYYRLTHFHEHTHQALFTPQFFELLGDKFAIDVYLDKFRQSDARNLLDALLYVDLHLYLPDTLMPKTDIAGMAHGLEARMPMLDHKFLEFTARIPPEFKLKDSVTSKYIFKKAVEPFLPQDVIDRRKMGFGVPIDHWFRDDLKELAYDTILSQKALDRGYFQRWYLEFLLDRHQAGESNQYTLWNLLMLEFWHQMFIDKTLSPPASPGSKPHPGD